MTKIDDLEARVAALEAHLPPAARMAAPPTEEGTQLRYVLPTTPATSAADLDRKLAEIREAHPHLRRFEPQGLNENLLLNGLRSDFEVCNRALAHVERRADGVDEKTGPIVWLDRLVNWSADSGFGVPSIWGISLIYGCLAAGIAVKADGEFPDIRLGLVRWPGGRRA